MTGIRWAIGACISAAILAPPLVAQGAQEVAAVHGTTGVQPAPESLLSQPARLHISGVTVAEALTLLSRTSNVSIAFSPSAAPFSRRVDCDCDTLPVAGALDRILEGTGFGYAEVFGQILVARTGRSNLSRPLTEPRTTYALAFANTAAMYRSAARTVTSLTPIELPRAGTISGRVVDAATQQPLSTVQVHIPELEIGTLTTPGGLYTLPNVPAGTHTVVAEVIGYRPERQEVVVADDSTVVVNFQLVQTAVALDEVVVVGYGEQTRATVSGSVSTIESEDINRSSYSTVSDMLVGKVAGINTRMTVATGTTQFAGRVPQDGRPGAGAALQIRNMGSPLYVIDGVPATELEFNQLGPADIENISVLKDASASVYGFRAANGVVLITTKRGSVNTTPQMHISGEYGWQNLPRERDPMGWGNTAYHFMYSIVESQQNLGQPRTIPPDELERWRVGGPGYESHPAWDDFVVPNAPQWTLNANVAGGTAESRYYIGLGHVSQDYNIPDHNFSRTNVQANLTTEVFTGFRVGTEIRGRQEVHTTVANTNSSSITNVGDPLLVFFQGIRSMWPHQDNWANGNKNYINGDVRYFIRSPGSWRRSVGGPQDQVRTNLTANLWAEYELPLGAKIRGTYSRTKDLEEFDQHRYTFHGYCYDAETDAYNICDTYEDKSRRQIRAIAWRDFFNLQVSHSLNIGLHSLSAVAGLERSGGEEDESQIYSIPSSNFNSLIQPSEVLDARTSWNIHRRASYFGRINYDYDRKYLFEALGRYDGSYLYAPGKRWGFFPGFSIGWRITEEPFIRDRFSFLDELKIRASWGQAGREQGISNWGYLEGATLGSGTPSVLSGQVVPGVALRGLAVTNLSWVTSTSRNVGFDVALFGGKLAGEFDIFERRLTGLPASRYDVALPLEIGYNLPNENLESEANLGFEGVLTYRDRIGNVAFSVSPNITVARRKILDRYKPRYASSWHRYRYGTEHRWADANFLDHYTGKVFQSIEEIARYPVDLDGQGNRTLLPGDYIWEDTNGDGLVNVLDQRVRGYGNNHPPIVNFGLNGSFSYAGFTLSYDFAGGAMYSIALDNNVGVPYGTDHNSGSYIWARWRRADPYDDNSEWIPGKFPPLRKGQNNASSYRNGDVRRFNGKYVRLRRLELGYQVPTDFANRFGFGELQVYSSATNKWVLDNTLQWGIDPEIAYGGALLYPYPNLVNFGFRARIGGRPSQIATAPVGPGD